MSYHLRAATSSLVELGDMPARRAGIKSQACFESEAYFFLETLRVFFAVFFTALFAFFAFFAFLAMLPS